VEKDVRFNQQVDRSTGFHTHSVACAPMIVRGKTIGVIEAINRREGDFSNSDVALLLTLAAQAAIAIENAELYASLISERDKLIDKEEEVRRELARDLHDGPAQVISGMAMRISLIKKLLSNEPEQVLPELNELEKVALTTAKDIRTMMFGLRPLMLETKGLIPTLEAYVEKLQSEPWGTHLEVEGFKLPDDTYRRLPHGTENTFFIIIQEAINNIRKHAEPKNVWIRLAYSEVETVVMVQDDGKGFDMDLVSGRYEERTSFGLLNMKERSRLINASFFMSSKPGQGTSIIMVIKPRERLQMATGPLTGTLPQLFPMQK
jgi:signal transduction histidine kinase